MLYNDLQKVMKVIDEIQSISHCNVAELMVKNLAKMYGLTHTVRHILTPSWVEYDPIVYSLLDKIHNFRNELNC